MAVRWDPYSRVTIPAWCSKWPKTDPVHIRSALGSDAGIVYVLGALGYIGLKEEF